MAGAIDILWQLKDPRNTDEHIVEIQEESRQFMAEFFERVLVWVKERFRNLFICVHICLYCGQWVPSMYVYYVYKKIDRSIDI